MRHARYLGFGLTVMILAGLGLAACNLPGATTSTPTPIPVAPPAETSPPPTTDHPVESPPTDEPAGFTPDPSVTPLAPLAPGAELEITWIGMQTTLEGWAIGGPPGSSEHVFRTVDGGESWEEVTPPQEAAPAGTQVASGAFLDSRFGWVVYHPASRRDGTYSSDVILWSTADGGEHWARGAALAVDLSGGTVVDPGMRIISQHEGWILLYLGPAGMHRHPVYLLYTDDGGRTWEVLISPYGGIYLQSCTKTGWAFFEHTGLVSIGSCPIDGVKMEWSSDAGRTWTEIRPPLPEDEEALAAGAGCDIHSPHLFNRTSWLAGVTCLAFTTPTTTLHYLYRTADEGATWSILPYPGGELVFLDEEHGWALGKENHVTEDGGLTWTRLSIVSWEGQYNLVDPDTIWAVARAGDEIALVRSLNGGRSWAIVEPVLGP